MPPESAPRARLRIGQVAAASGLTVETIRYYEQLGLLPRPTRTAGRVRSYSDDVLARLRLIAQAKALGMALVEIRDLMVTDKPRGVACREVHRTLTARIDEVDAKLAALRDLRRTLVSYQAACARALRATPEPSCPTLRAMSTNGPATRASGR